LCDTVHPRVATQYSKSSFIRHAWGMGYADRSILQKKRMVTYEAILMWAVMKTKRGRRVSWSVRAAPPVEDSETFGTALEMPRAAG
jgi:hypothetical protein